MNPKTTIVVRMVIFGLAGACLTLLLGLAAVVLAPDDGFSDLAAAALTTVFLIPLGLISGALIGWFTRRRFGNGWVETAPTSRDGATEVSDPASLEREIAEGEWSVGA